MKVLLNRAVVNTAKEFFELSKKINNKIIILFVSAKENEERRKILKTQSKIMKPITGTQKLHYVKPDSLFQLKTAQNSPFTLNDEAEKSYHTHNVYENEIKAKSTEHILKPAVGSFITVDINSTNPKILNRLYVAQICSIDQDNAVVLFLRKCGKTNKTFHFPEKEDRSWVNFL